MKQTTRLIDILKLLRDPDKGCAWTQEQDFKSLAPYTLEEAYEVVDAIHENDPEKLKDELGDLLLQIIYQSQIADELGLFNFEDVAETISNKMERRHTHIFSDDSALTAEDVNKKWEINKAKERKENNYKSELDGIARALPALTRAEKISKRAARAGFEWSEFQSVIDKVEEEIQEFRIEVEEETPERHEEFGDILFSLVNVARWQGIDPDAAMRDANDKFEWRFRHMEQHASASLNQFDLNELEDLWSAAKQAEYKLKKSA